MNSRIGWAPRELAEALGYSSTSIIYESMSRGEIPWFQLTPNGRKFIPDSWVQNKINEKCGGVSPSEVGLTYTSHGGVVDAARSGRRRAAGEK